MIYEPREDSYLLANVVDELAFGEVLDIGTGSGIQAQTAKQNDAVTSVLAADINPEAVLQAKNTGINAVQSDKFEQITGVFDTIICNTPYLPEEPLAPDIALDGGKKGYEWTIDFLQQAKTHLKADGHILMLISTLTNPDVVKQEIINLGYEYELIAQQKIHFETLLVYKITHAVPQHPNAAYVASGKRSRVYKLKDVAIKKARPRRIQQEALMLEKVNSLGIGPQYIKNTDTELYMEFIDGVRIDHYLQTATTKECEHILTQVRNQCEVLDTKRINKSEMKNPYKHVLIRNSRAVLIDWERAKYSPRPQNTNQFNEYLKKHGYKHLI